MKQLLMFILFPALLCACSKEENTPMEGLNDPGIPTGTVLAQGVFSGTSSYKVTGSVKLIEANGVKTLRFENFISSNGPDLKVYLAKDINAVNFISLGVLKSTSGNQNYTVSGMPDISQYRYALIWCQQFGALFGSAQLK